MSRQFNTYISRVFLISFFIFTQFITVYSPIAFAVQAPTPPRDICIDASESAFCADRIANPPGGDPIDNDSSPILGPSSIFYKILQTVTLLTGAISIIMVIVGGFRYIISGGDSAATKAAKDTILYAVIGLAVTIFAQTIITFVLSNL